MVLGIRAIKLYAWETPYVARIMELRDAELLKVRQLAVLGIANTAIGLGVFSRSATAYKGLLIDLFSWESGPS